MALMSKFNLTNWLIVAVLAILCPLSLKLVSAAPDASVSVQLDGAHNGQSSMDMANNGATQQEQAQQFFDPNNLLEYGLNPVGSAMKYFMPNTYQGVSSDLSKGMMMLTNGAGQGVSSVQSQFSSLGDQLANRYSALQQNYLNRQQQLYQQQEALLNRVYDILANPEQFCRQLSDRTNSMVHQSGQQANQMLDQANQKSSSFMNKLSSSFPVFG